LEHCSNCGKVLPEGALFCPDCGTAAVAVSVPLSGSTSSHFNAGMTATPVSQTTAPDAGRAYSPPWVQEKKRLTFTGRGFLLVVIAVLVVLLSGALIEAVNFGQGGASPQAINSPTTPFSGGQLYSAYASNQTQASADYTNKTLYIKDSLDFGVNRAFDGQYFSSVNAGTVILIWNDQTQVGQLSAGSVVLAKCSVQGLQAQQGTQQLYLQGCDLISVQTATTTYNVSSNNL